MVRPIGSFVVAAVLLSAVGASSVAAEDAATGNLVGHVVFCRALAAPVALADDGSSPLADVTPGGRLRKLSPKIVIPAADLQLAIQGTGLGTRTDATGAFTLSGVPTAQPLTLLAQVDPGRAWAFSIADLRVGPGQTRDLGSLALPGCAGSAGVLIGTPPGSVAEAQTQTDADAAAQPAEPPVAPDDAN